MSIKVKATKEGRSKEGHPKKKQLQYQSEHMTTSKVQAVVKICNPSKRRTLSGPGFLVSFPPNATLAKGSRHSLWEVKDISGSKFGSYNSTTLYWRTKKLKPRRCKTLKLRIVVPKGQQASLIFASFSGDLCISQVVAVKPVRACVYVLSACFPLTSHVACGSHPHWADSHHFPSTVPEGQVAEAWPEAHHHARSTRRP